MREALGSIPSVSKCTVLAQRTRTWNSTPWHPGSIPAAAAPVEATGFNPPVCPDALCWRSGEEVATPHHGTPVRFPPPPRWKLRHEVEALQPCRREPILAAAAPVAEATPVVNAECPPQWLHYQRHAFFSGHIQSFGHMVQWYHTRLACGVCPNALC